MDVKGEGFAASDTPARIQQPALLQISCFAASVLREKLSFARSPMVDVTCDSGDMAASLASNSYFSSVSCLDNRPEVMTTLSQLEKLRSPKIDVLNGVSLESLFIHEYQDTRRPIFQTMFPSAPIIMDVDVFHSYGSDYGLLHWCRLMLKKGCSCLFLVFRAADACTVAQQSEFRAMSRFSFDSTSESVKVLALAGFRHPVGPLLPSVQSRRQFEYLLTCSGGGDLKARLNHVLRMVKFRTIPEAHARVVGSILRDVALGLNDEVIYDNLFALAHRDLLRDPHIIERLDQNKQQSRAENRVDDLVSLLTAFVTVDATTRFLDFGCSEGSITSALAAALHISPERAFGCDVFPVQNKTGFQFSMTDGIHLPFDNESFPFVTALMSLHHVENLNESFLEIARVLKPGGILLIREHDCQPAELSVLLDVMHGMYASVWADPRETEDFCTSYWAHYRSRDEWNRFIVPHGFSRLSIPNERPLPQPVLMSDPQTIRWNRSFEECLRSKNLVGRQDRAPVNAFRHYYEVFRKEV
eukprot:ANDGO_05477.mRNA.1 Demethylrebeccamycin-D-glucose O-methyltransferase